MGKLTTLGEPVEVGRAKQWTQSQHLSINHGDEGTHFHFPTKLLCVQAVTVGTTVLPLLLKLVPLHYIGVTSIKSRLSGNVRERSGCFLLQGLSQNIIILRLLNTKKHCEKEQTPDHLIQECPEHHIVHFGNPEVLPPTVLWLTLEVFCRYRTKITDVINCITLLWGKQRSWDQSSFNQILLCESYFNWILV